MQKTPSIPLKRKTLRLLKRALLYTFTGAASVGSSAKSDVDLLSNVALGARSKASEALKRYHNVHGVQSVERRR